MNKITSIAIAAAALSVVSGVQADTTIRLTGSTAFRSAVFAALKNDFFNVTPVTVPGNASGSSSTVTFIGTNTALFGANTKVIIECAYSGSVEGLVNVLGTSSSSPVGQPVFLKPDGSNDSVTQADLALSDVAQSTTTFDTATYGTAFEYLEPSYNHQGVGVVTFGFVANRNSGNNVANITSSQFQELAANGSLSKGYFTGAGNADTTAVYLTGRYPFSGTRLTVGAVTGLGANSSQALYANDGADGITGTGVVVPAGNILSGSGAVVFDNPTDQGGGYVSGGTIARVLNNSAATVPIISYLGLGDVRGAKSNDNSVVQPLNDRLLTFNGIAATRANVIRGVYEFWGYERLYGKVGTQSSDVTKFVKGTTSTSHPINSNGFFHALDVELHNDLDYVSLKEMKATRSGDGAVIAPSY